MATILAVDDDPAALCLLQDLLTHEGYRVRLAPNGFEALAAIDRDPPDLVVLDWNMPGLSGLDVCRAIRESAKARVSRTPVVMLTAHNAPQDMQAALSAGASDFLTKPFKPAHLFARTATLIRQPS